MELQKVKPRKFYNKNLLSEEGLEQDLGRQKVYEIQSLTNKISGILLKEEQLEKSDQHLLAKKVVDVLDVEGEIVLSRQKRALYVTSLAILLQIFSANIVSTVVSGAMG